MQLYRLAKVNNHMLVIQTFSIELLPIFPETTFRPLDWLFMRIFVRCCPTLWKNYASSWQLSPSTAAHRCTAAIKQTSFSPPAALANNGRDDCLPGRQKKSPTLSITPLPSFTRGCRSLLLAAKPQMCQSACQAKPVWAVEHEGREEPTSASLKNPFYSSVKQAEAEQEEITWDVIHFWDVGLHASVTYIAPELSGLMHLTVSHI